MGLFRDLVERTTRFYRRSETMPSDSFVSEAQKPDIGRVAVEIEKSGEKGNATVTVSYAAFAGSGKVFGGMEQVREEELREEMRKHDGDFLPDLEGVLADQARKIAVDIAESISGKPVYLNGEIYTPEIKKSA